MFSGKSHGFSLPGALRRGKSNGQRLSRHIDERDDKAQHILGITKTALDSARSQSMSSSIVAARPSGPALSDATTEFGSPSTPPPPVPRDLPTLHLKASSVLLHEEFNINETTPSSRPRRLQQPISSSSLHSYYDGDKMPLAISQQTSESSRRDLALRKDASPSTSDNMASPRSLRLLRSLTKSQKSDSRKLVKQNPPPSSIIRSPRNTTHQRHGEQTLQHHQHSQEQINRTKSFKGVRFQNATPERESHRYSAKHATSSNTLNDTQHMKINSRKPKAGAKYWFDNIDVDISDIESIHEPEFSPSFVSGMALAFESGRFDPVPENTEDTSQNKDESRASAQDAVSQSSKKSSRYHLPPSAIPPRVSTLTAKASRTSLSQGVNQQTFQKTKAASLASTNLHTNSILDLSSSDDDEVPPPVSIPKAETLPRLRDSIALDDLMESEIEIVTAKAIDTKQSASLEVVPEARKVKERDLRHTSIMRQSRTPDRSAYFSDHSSERYTDDNDLLVSFPATPTETSASRRFPQYGSDTASIESRRLMSVTRQEESLLAAMRLKRAALDQTRYSPRRLQLQAQAQASRTRTPDLSVRQYRSPPQALSSNSLDILSTSRPRHQNMSHSGNPEIHFDQASCTTFQTGASHDASHRFSIASCGTEASIGPYPELQSPLAVRSPSFRATVATPANRMSQSTFFSTSTGTNDSLDRFSSRADKAYAANLERFQQVSVKDDAASQDYIDWPYSGWEPSSKAAVAQAVAH
ncbi:hypothetical protein B0A52_07599 [Exophiala mesophila]|uniref:Uncharacterized protein n=1 Tax=Exophiala mesophila TaxID=212818 RepID=A0A438MY88_EXOME|nr:hypothetical protein B0A52_07599 [Exophiala mesophila]